MNVIPPHFHRTDRISETDIIPDGRTVAVVPNWPAPEGTEITYLASGVFRRYKMVDGSWQVIGAAAASTYAHGVFTKNMADASTSQNIAHGLGVVPKFVRITAYFSDGTHSLISLGTYDGSTMQNIFTYPGPDTASTTTAIIKLIPALGGNIQDATATVDVTNIILDWTKTGSPTGSAYIHWEAYA